MSKRAARAAAEPALKRMRSTDRPPVARSPAPRADRPAKSFRLVSWNIVTMRSLIEKRRDLLERLLSEEQPDVVCFQETKLKEKDVEKTEKALAGIFKGYSFHWVCSTGKQGYSGCVAITKDTCSPLRVSTGLPTLSDDGIAAEAAKEGRVITMEYDQMYIVAAYVPNSGQDLKRLSFRVKEWDRSMEQYLQALASAKPVMLCGDLNVAHRVDDIYNAGGIEGVPAAKHLEKTAGTTTLERDSFTKLLDAGFVDTFRHQHPDAKGWYSYWSVRAGNHPYNRGLRLDYVVASKSLVDKEGDGPKVVDSAILPEFVVDHSPVSCTLSL